MSVTVNLINSAWASYTLNIRPSGYEHEVYVSGINFQTYMESGKIYRANITHPNITGLKIVKTSIVVPFAGPVVIARVPNTATPLSNQVWEFTMEESPDNGLNYFGIFQADATQRTMAIGNTNYSINFAIDQSLSNAVAFRKLIGNPVSFTIGSYTYDTTVDAGITYDYLIKVPDATNTNVVNNQTTVSTIPTTVVTDLVQLPVMSMNINQLRNTSRRFTSSIPCTQAIIYDHWDGTVSPPKRGGHSTVVYNNKLYVFGGYNGSSFFNDFWRYDISSESWTALISAGPSARYAHHSSLLLLDYIYTFGGWNGSSFLNDIWKYDIALNTWSNPVNVGGPTGRQNHVVATFDAIHMLVFSGKGAGGVTNDVWVYNTLSETWFLFNNTGGPPQARTNSNGCAVDWDLYMFGGGDNSDNPLGDFWKYNFLAQTWTQLIVAGTPSARFWHGMASVGTDVYVYGGVTNIGGQPFDELYKFNTLNNTWTNITTAVLPYVPRSFSTFLSYFNNLVIVGGYLPGGPGVGVLNDVWMADVNNNPITFNAKKSGPTYVIGNNFTKNDVTFTASVSGGVAVVDAYVPNNTPNSTSLYFESFRIETSN